MNPLDTRDPARLADAHRARALLARYATIPSDDRAARDTLLRGLFGSVGEGVWVESPFSCDYGRNIHVGDGTFVNAQCVFLDGAEIRIGRDVLIAPGVQLLTVTHPVAARERLTSDAERAAGAPPYRTRAAPITIGDRCWLGAGVLVMPGVTIGAETVVGAGSVVTRDLPAGVLAVGSPARVARALDR